MDLGMLLERTYNVIEKPAKLLELVASVQGKLRSVGESIRFRPPGLYEINYFDELYVIGDLHGDFATLLDIVEKNKIVERIGGKNTILLFLGDYIDRGNEQLEVLVFVLLLKNYYPDKTLLLRGNHEPSPTIMPYPHDFPEQLYVRYGEEAKTIYSRILQLFQRLCYVARIPGKALFLHGGPPTTVLKAKSFEEAFSIGKPVVDDQVLEEILWNDPISDSTIPYASSPRGAGKLFGEAVTDQALKLSNTKYIVRGHEAVEGYKVDHRGKVITLFDSKIPYGISKASYLHLKGLNSLNNIMEHIHVV